MKRRNLLGMLFFAFCLPGLSITTKADGNDHDLARRASEAGEILPLRDILAIIERDFPGQIIEIELERDDGLWLYEIKLIRSGGMLAKIKLNARDGSLLKIKDRGGRERAGGKH